MNRRTALISAACALMLARGTAGAIVDVRAAIRRHARSKLVPLPIVEAPRDEAIAWSALAPLVHDLHVGGDCSERSLVDAVRRALDRDAAAGRFIHRDGAAMLATHFGLARLAMQRPGSWRVRG